MFYVYILRCSDNSLYIGYTTNVEARLKAHNICLGSAHTSKRLPVELAYSEAHPTRLAAVHRERQLKGWTRQKKETLIDGDLGLLRALSKRRNQDFASTADGATSVHAADLDGDAILDVLSGSANDDTIAW